MLFLYFLSVSKREPVRKVEDKMDKEVRNSF